MTPKENKNPNKTCIIGKLISIDRDALKAKIKDNTNGSELTAQVQVLNIQNRKCILIPKIDSDVLCSKENDIVTLGSGIDCEVAYFINEIGYLTESEIEAEIKVNDKIMNQLKHFNFQVND